MAKPTGASPAEPVKDLAAATLAEVRKSLRGLGRAKNTAGESQRVARYRRPTGTDLSGPGPDDRDPVALGAGVAELVVDRGWESQTKVAAVVGRWADIAGADLASHVSPETFDESSGLLRLKAESTTWATQVKLLIPELQRRLDAEIGTGIVRQIEVTGPIAPRRGFGQLRVPGRGPRDTYG